MRKIRGTFLVGATILVLPLVVGVPGAAIAQRIGITSAVTGDPTGKPPDEIERVLHVGIDVTAGEVVTTGAADRAHLLFLDGTALTISNQARVTLDRFVYDADQKLGDLAITATKGVFRLVGGKISKKTPVIVVTPSATLTTLPIKVSASVAVDIPTISAQNSAILAYTCISTPLNFRRRLRPFRKRREFS